MCVLLMVEHGSDVTVLRVFGFSRRSTGCDCLEVHVSELRVFELCLLSHSETLLWRNRSLSSAVIMDCFFFYDERMLVAQFACDFPSCRVKDE